MHKKGRRRGLGAETLKTAVGGIWKRSGSSRRQDCQDLEREKGLALDIKDGLDFEHSILRFVLGFTQFL